MTERPGLARAGSHDADLQRRFAASRRHRPVLSHCFEPACAAGRLAADSLVPARWRVSLRAGACACSVVGAALRGADFMPSGAAGMAPGVSVRGRGRGRDGVRVWASRLPRHGPDHARAQASRAAVRPSGSGSCPRRMRTRCCPGAWASIPSRSRPARGRPGHGLHAAGRTRLACRHARPGRRRARAATPPSPVHPRSARPVRRARVDASGPIHPPASPSPIHKADSPRDCPAHRAFAAADPCPCAPARARVRRPLPFPDP